MMADDMADNKNLSVYEMQNTWGTFTIYTSSIIL